MVLKVVFVLVIIVFILMFLILYLEVKGSRTYAEKSVYDRS